MQDCIIKDILNKKTDYGLDTSLIHYTLQNG